MNYTLSTISKKQVLGVVIGIGIGIFALFFLKALIFIGFGYLGYKIAG